MYVSREDLLNKIEFPQGSTVAVFGDSKEAFDDLAKRYKLSDTVDEGTRFALVRDTADTGLNAYRLTKKNIPFCIVGSRPENVFLRDVLWNGAEPFVPKVAFPDFIVATDNSKRADMEFAARLIFAVAEKITVEILLNGYSDTVFPVWFSSPTFIKDYPEEVFGLAKSVSGRIDGLKQAESALTLLKAKEEIKFRRNDTVVLLAKYLSKVYNCFIKCRPSSIFPPDNNAREEALTEFFGVKAPQARRLRSEFEIRKLYYMISENSGLLGSLWDSVCEILDKTLSAHRMYTENNGFCLEEISEDAKFATFISPDLLKGDTLLAFIKDCGVADNFI